MEKEETCKLDDTKSNECKENSGAGSASMFNNAIRPKAYFTMWIMMNQRLVTVDREMWGRLLSWIEQQSNVTMTWEQFLQWCIQHGKGKSSAAQIFKIILTESIYGLWMERNSRIF
ncbi:hypothetical protein EJD97_022172 [Solanum chilense]|uniref:Reverse transcriptase zinc-binding domain-containing protein n=1 Tax=Solanum chilense TaxID=4083 RepID=A0A6N2AFA4_SOLCI|nr:hypothetical protein EJD97_022172 [Solanum chilense]